MAWSMKLPKISKPLKWFLAGMILANISGEMIFIFFPVYFTNLGASVTQVGMMFTVASLVPLALQIVGGWLSDTIGRLRTIALGSLGGLLGYIGMALAPTWEWAILALSLEYISGSLVGPSFAAYIAEQSDETERGRTFGLITGIFQIVTVIGPSLGGFIAGRLGFRPLMAAGAIIYGLATILRLWMALSARFAHPQSGGVIHLASLKTNIAMIAGMITAGGVFTWIFITDGIVDISQRLSSNLLSLFMTQVGGLTVEQIGGLTSLMGISIMGAMFTAGYLSDRMGERVTIAAGFGLMGAGILTFVISPSLAGFTLSSILFGAGRGTVSPAYSALVSKVVPERQRGIAYGLVETSLGVFSLPAPWAGSQLWRAFSPRVPFLITAGAALLSIIPVWFKFKTSPNPGSVAEVNP